jgi:hypothetical protein
LRLHKKLCSVNARFASSNGNTVEKQKWSLGTIARCFDVLLSLTENKTHK